MTYAEKLKDPRWQKLRLQIMERDGFRCLHCGAKDKTLHVHHAVYEKRDPWDCETRNLGTLCEDCHAKVERVIRLSREWISRSVFARKAIYCLLMDAEDRRVAGDRFTLWQAIAELLGRPQLIELLSTEFEGSSQELSWLLNEIDHLSIEELCIETPS